MAPPRALRPPGQALTCSADPAPWGHNSPEVRPGERVSRGTCLGAPSCWVGDNKGSSGSLTGTLLHTGPDLASRLTERVSAVRVHAGLLWPCHQLCRGSGGVPQRGQGGGGSAGLPLLCCVQAGTLRGPCPLGPSPHPTHTPSTLAAPPPSASRGIVTELGPSGHLSFRVRGCVGSPVGLVFPRPTVYGRVQLCHPCPL